MNITDFTDTTPATGTLANLTEFWARTPSPATTLLCAAC
jgi:hypothetical protein